MPAEADMVTVFRSADDVAEEDAKAVHEILAGQGIDAVVLDDTAPGVPAGAWEVQVPPSDSARAEELIAEARLPDTELTEVNESPDLDAETVLNTSSEFEALSAKGMLESAGIGTVMGGDSVLPNLPFEVKVAKEQVDEARELLAAAQEQGAQSAEEEERSTEIPLNP